MATSPDGGRRQKLTPAYFRKPPHLYELGPEAAIWMEGFLQKYANQSPQLADASLMYVAETENIVTFFTLDRRDFSVYRLSGNKLPTLLP
jgi:hypothetical protein